MANVKISALTSASTPLAGTEVLPIVQSSATVKVAVADLTAGRAISALSLNSLTVGLGAGSVATNTAVGVSALAANTTGAFNTAVGNSALPANTTSSSNTAVGYQALYSNTTGTSSNEAFGREALRTNTTGGFNQAFGNSALYYNTTGSYCVAMGTGALQSNTTADGNTAVGYQAGYTNTTGTYNTYVGWHAGYVATGGGNSYLGTTAGYAMTTGSKNTIIGAYGGNQGGLDIRTASNYVVFSDGDGNPVGWFDNNTNFFCPRTYLNTTATAANVVVGSNGSYARSTSALKYKQDIRELESMDINSLRPVRYKSKCKGDDQTKDHFGLIADEAADAGFEELVSRNASGEVEGFQYERLTVVLLKAMQTLKAEFDAYKLAHP
jgi:hypothetical protein